MLAANLKDLRPISRTYIVERENSFLQVNLDMGMCVHGVWLVCVCVRVYELYACVKVCELYVCYRMGTACMCYRMWTVYCYNMWIVCLC